MSSPDTTSVAPRRPPVDTAAGSHAATYAGSGPVPVAPVAEPSPTAAPTAAVGRREPGFIAVEWLVAMVFLLIPVVLLGAGASQWPERQQVARAASSEGARAAVLADSQAEALAEATRVADQVAANYGIPPDQYTVLVEAPVWDWGEEVTVTVRVTMPALNIPGLGGGGSWAPTEWSTSSTQRIEDYRGLGE